jgi:hypothetical protein
MTFQLSRRLLVAPLSLAVVASTTVAAAELSGSATASVPAVPALSTSLFVVSAAPHSSDVWALGRWSNSKSASQGTIVSHRHHGHWTDSKTPKLSPSAVNQTTLTGIAALSGKTAWVTGYSFNSKTGKQAPVIEKTVGTKLVKVKTPFKLGYLSVISSSGAKNVWILGSKLVGTLSTSVIEHWNGHRWSAPKLPTGFSPTSVTTSGAKNAFALGSTVKGTQVARWNGRKWSLTSYKVPSGAQALYIATASAHSTFVVGYRTAGTVAKPVNKNYTARFNGRKWKTLTTPSKAGSTLNGVTAVGSVAWAIGYAVTKAGTLGAEILHFTGGKWHPQSVPTPGTSQTLSWVAASTASIATAVGNYAITKVPCGPTRAFNLMYNGHSWGNGSSPPAQFRGASFVHVAAVSGYQPADLGC